MKKLLKLSFVLSIFIFTISCSNIKSTSLVGTYKSEDGKVLMMVSSDGNVSFNSAGNASIEENTLAYALVTTYISESGARSGYTQIDSLGGALNPWDLTTDKPQSYEINGKIEVRKTTSGVGMTQYQSPSTTTNTIEVSRKFDFTKNGSQITCKLVVSGIKSPMVGKDGDMTFTK